jgi:prevent-host-death family protein
MKSHQIRYVKANLSGVVAQAENSQPTITRHGRPSAMVVPMEAGQRPYPGESISFADHLLCMPEPLETERDNTPLRGIDL